MQKYFLCLMALLFQFVYGQQVGINTNTPDPSAALDIQSAGKGLLIPRVTKAARLAITSPANGLMVFQNSTDSAGFYYYYNNWHYINYDSTLPPTAIVLSRTYPNTRLQNNNFKYNGAWTVPNAQLTTVVPTAMNVWLPLDTTKANYPTPASYSVLSTWVDEDSTFLITGGYSNVNSTTYPGVPVYAYNPYKQTWSLRATPSIIPSVGSAAVKVGTKWFIWMGYADLSVSGGTAWKALIYDVVNKTTANSTSPGGLSRSRCTVSAVGNNVYIWGGNDIMSASTQFNTGVIYNTNTGVWSSMSTTNAPAARIYSGSVGVGTNVVVWGGYSSGLGGFTTTGGIYNTLTDAWTATSATNAPATGTMSPAMAAYNGKVYVISGAETKRLDPSTNTWTTMSAPPFSFSGQKFSYDGNGKLYVWGGPDYFMVGSAISNAGYIYDLATDTYTTLPASNAPVARKALGMSSGKGLLFVWGGSTSVNNTTAVDVIRSGAIFTESAQNVQVTQPMETLYMYEKQ